MWTLTVGGIAGLTNGVCPTIKSAADGFSILCWQIDANFETVDAKEKSTREILITNHCNSESNSIARTLEQLSY